MKRILLIFLIAALSISIVGCSTGGNKASESSKPTSSTGEKETDSKEKEETLPLRFYSQGYQTSISVASHDVVTPYVEEKFNLKLGEMYLNNDQPLKERLNQWIATKNLPDFMIMDKANANYAISTGEFANLTDYIKDMPNLQRLFEQSYWPRFKNDGQNYQIPMVVINANDPKYEDDPYNSGKSNLALRIREDLLAKTGYKFKTLQQIKKETLDVGKKPTAEDFAIEPAIKTPEDFYAFLKKVKDLDLKMNGKPIIPISFSGWTQFHFGSMFDFGHWTIDKDGTTDGFFGSKGAKDYHQYLNRLYQEGLLDKDFIIQKDDQLQTKAATGQLAVMPVMLNTDAARQALLSIDPSYEIRAIPWPKVDPDKGFYDIYEGAFWRGLVRKDFPDIKRLIAYLDWTLSDEALDLMSWGPESAGLWKLDGDKKLFTDPEVESDMLSGKLGGKGADYYGLYSNIFYSKASYFGLSWFMGQAGYNPKSPKRSYPPQLDIYIVNQALVGGGSYNVQGTASYGDGSKEVDAVGNYYWSKIAALDVAKLLTPKTPAEFEKAWDTIYGGFEKEVDYEKAKQNMLVWFSENK
jgi:putative aldouronate transport system substrate-binding protein